MLLNNLKNIFYGYAAGSAQHIPNLSGSGINVSLNSVQTIQSLTSYNVQLYGVNAGNSWIDVGYGDDAVTGSDYCLADSNYSNRKLTAIAAGRNTPTLGDIFNGYMNFRNDTAENVIVKEIGICGNPTSGNNIVNMILYYRKVLDNPITIAPGEVYSFNYKVRIKDS